MNLSVYWDIQSKQFVRGITDAGVWPPPDLHQEDKINFAFTGLKRISYSTPPLFERIPLAGYGLRISVGVAGTVYASQGTWTLDSTGYIYTGVLDLDTAPIDGLTDLDMIKLEVVLTDGDGNPYHGTWDIRVRKAVYTAGSALPTPSINAISEELANARFVKVAGVPRIILTDPDTGEKMMLFIRNRSLQSTMIT